MTPAPMRLRNLISWITLCGVAALWATVVNAQPTAQVPGRIVVVKVRGTVTATNMTDHTQTTLVDNDKISQNYVVTTAAGSSVILVFSNGATLNLGADSTLAINEYLQDPFSSQVVVGNLKEEPTTSTTKLNLTRGELVGNVKHLHQDRGSSFTVNTPVGAAGIRGTTFRIVFKPGDNGQWTFSLSTAEGQVVFEGTVTNGSIPVDAGKEISVKVDVKIDPNTGEITQVTAEKIRGVHDMSADDMAALTSLIQQALDTSAPVIFNSSGTGGGRPGGSSSSPDGATPSSDTTPGDGSA